MRNKTPGESGVFAGSAFGVCLAHIGINQDAWSHNGKNTRCEAFNKLKSHNPFKLAVTVTGKMNSFTGLAASVRCPTNPPNLMACVTHINVPHQMN